MKRLLYLITFLTLSGIKADAGHIVGAQLYYDCLGNNNYQITFVEYRNCAPCAICADYDEPVYIQIFDTAGNYINYTSISVPPRDTLQIADSAHCSNSDICIELAQFQAIVNLPYLPGGYILVYQRCCRNLAISNIPQNTGATYFTYVPDSMAQPSCNSRPRFSQVIPQISPIDTPFLFDMSATDPDNDSLVYRMVSSYDGASNTCPDPSPLSAGTGCPTMPSPPPYVAVPFISPYSAGNPTNNPPDSGYLRIDPHTGVLSGRVNQSGVFLVAVAADEYRNGLFLGSTLFDFQFTFTACQSVNDLKAIETSERIKIYSNGDAAIIEFGDIDEGAMISFYDLLGRELNPADQNNSVHYTRRFNLPTQYIIAKVQLSSGEVIYKKLLISKDI